MITEAPFSLPPGLVYPVAFLFGALWGSFLNVCIVRFPEGESVVWPASRCPKCRTPIRPYDNIPIFSWLWLRGRCRACREPISARYPIVELLMALLTVALVQRYGLSMRTLAYFVLTMGLVVVTFVDAVYWIIPNEVSYGLAFAGLAFSFVDGATVRPLEAALGLAAGGLGLFLVAWLFKRLRGVEGLGDGDWKLLAGLGAYLGWRALPVVLFLAATQGVVVAAVVYLARRGKPLSPAPLPEPPSSEAKDDRHADAKDDASADGKPETSSDAKDDASADGKPETSTGAKADGSADVPTDARAEAGEGEPAPGRLALPFGPLLALAAFELVFFGPALWRLIERLSGGALP